MPVAAAAALRDASDLESGRPRLDPTLRDAAMRECGPKNEPSFPLRTRCIHFESRNDVNIYITGCNLIS